MSVKCDSHCKGGTAGNCLILMPRVNVKVTDGGGVGGLVGKGGESDFHSITAPFKQHCHSAYGTLAT